MKKLYIIMMIGVMTIFGTTSCDESLDINTNPLVASSADPNAILPYVLVQYSNRKATELGTRILDVPQHVSACFNSPRNGATTSFLTGNTWFMMYNQVLGNLQLVELDAKEAGAPSNNVAAIAVILKAMTFYELSSIWGDVPFSQAINGQEFPLPTFDSQENVFRGVVDLLDEAMTLIDGMPATGVFDVSVGDLIYEGDMDNWRRFANSLKLRVLMLLRNKVNVDAQITTALSQPLIEDNSQAAMLKYVGGPGQSHAYNQLVEAFFGISNEAQEVYGVGEPLYDALVNNSDPREGLFIADPDNGGAPDNGTFPAGEAVIADNIIRDNYPDVWFLPSEVSLYRAELALLNVSSDDAQTYYNQGVTQALQFWGQDIPGVVNTLSSSEISTYVSSLAAPTLADVHEQLYLESFLRPVVAWNTVRRTGVPALTPPPSANISTILKRFNYPPDEIGSNPNTPTNLPTDSPMWFEK
ncbi:SusD/RagB family nutrient-binding outer membrane lipoprotein [Fulvivirga lutimaris]|uniref:SusD/RagB family nutrient-binding outer membrane lipoprotein n=1 Tax=Fulvivirga lutimaris TaxID=1819566 RepID=UPI0012BD69E2|nr:SusD/RagB family nutrient-binding outer membrane lipoprotein [Fulvivirga lutimaris]MTI41643.1 SusD/RagB family nutrient-binding outer membrane lipoprotein [Fulvivirga lutimaris]